MFIEQPPLLYRLLFPEAIWRIPTAARTGRPTVYITFDDGPVPEVTPKVLDILDQFGIKATFFMVGDNAKRYPELLSQVLAKGHHVGNHTMHHLQGTKVRTVGYLRDVALADSLLKTPFFRPPHGIMRWAQSKAIKNRYSIIMYDVVTRDYNKKLSPQQVLANVKRFTRDGSIIVFHDSLKARQNVLAGLPEALQWLKDQGYGFAVLNHIETNNG